MMYGSIVAAIMLKYKFALERCDMCICNAMLCPIHVKDSADSSVKYIHPGQWHEEGHRLGDHCSSVGEVRC